MMVDGKCDVCDQEDCPCPVCHGDPKRYIGGQHSSEEHEDGTVTCPECARTS